MSWVAGVELQRNTYINAIGFHGKDASGHPGTSASRNSTVPSAATARAGMGGASR